MEILPESDAGQIVCGEETLVLHYVITCQSSQFDHSKKIDLKIILR